MSRARRDKKKENKKLGDQANKDPSIASRIGKAIGFLFTIIATFGLVNVYDKHVDLDVELNSIVHIIVEGDKIPAPPDLETSNWVLNRIDKKLNFIRSSQRRAHLNSFSLHYPRFNNIDSFTSLGVLRSASGSFRQIEKNNHENFAKLEAISSWKIALKKHNSSNSLASMTLSTAPNYILASTQLFNETITSYLKSSSGDIRGVYTNNPPTEVSKNYPVLDLKSSQGQKAVQQMTSFEPKGRYFIPAYEELRKIETATGSEVFKSEVRAGSELDSESSLQKEH
ncbi:hypothetical protein ACJVC5_03500 [Peredibacter sp. HCB2-198]|uniref:hypothetical protein n=1 Tax=Peredibacter sp. HCB2-198 TaxID=3383025 RepID=UPI0038B60BA7